jgi:uncharacterized protein (DUF885 family)
MPCGKFPRVNLVTSSSMIKSVPFAAAVLLAVIAVARAAPSAKTVNPDSPAKQLHELFAASDEASLKRRPIRALLRGDPRYADQFGDYISDAFFAAEKQAAVDDLAALARIARSALRAEDRVSYDVFEFKRTDELNGFDASLLKTLIERPIDHFFGFQVFVPELSSGEGAAPFKTVADYDNNLKRLEGYILYLDRAIGRMNEGLADGVTNPKLVMANVVEQLDTLIAEGVEGSTFYKPVKKFPDSVSAADRARLTVAYAEFIRDRLIPAHTRLREFIKNDYLPRARDTVGLGQMPGGPALYRYLVASTTTTDMTPEAIHALGLSEVKRIHAEMEQVKTTVGFKGTLTEFANFMRTDPKFAPTSPQAMRDAFVAINKRVLAAVPKDFALVPKSPLEIRPVPAYKEKTEAAGSYLQGTPDGSRPGVFYYDAYDLPSRFTWGFETLFLHEGIPGHHYQISLAQENTSLPAFQRFGGNTAYVEGWALYSESLGAELGMFTDPYQLYGHLNDEMLRAMRLVVDTGIHAQGWSRDTAIAYMLNNSAMGRTDATAEVERYIAIPSQALAYKVGQLTIRRLRTKAERELGPRFQVRAFHAQVLMSGALPMAVLQAKIDNWIAATKRE